MDECRVGGQGELPAALDMSDSAGLPAAFFPAEKIGKVYSKSNAIRNCNLRRL